MLHVIQTNIRWLADPILVFVPIDLLGIWKGVGWTAIIFLAGLQAIPTHLYEAAAVDGAGVWRRFRHITLPLLRPTLVFLIVVLTIGGLNAYISNLLITNDGDPLDLTHFVLTLMYKATFAKLDFGYGAAISYLLTVVVFMISVVQFRLLRREVDSSMGSKRQRALYAWLSYGLLLAGCVVVALPFWYMIATSLKPQAYIFEIPPRLWPAEPSLTNYARVLAKELFGTYFLNSLIVATASTAATMLVAGMLAYAFARFQFPGREPLFYLFLAGMMIPPVMLIIPQFILAKNLRLLDTHLGLIVVYVTMNLPMQTFLLRGFFEGLPRDLEDAALIDGAGRWTVFVRIILPLSTPALAVVAIFTFLYSWDEFPWAHVSIKEASRRTLPIAIALFQAQHLTEWGQVFAASLIALVPVVIVFVVFQRHFIRGIATTGMKG